MKISGFTMVRNAQKLYFPIKEAIMSILPIVDEFIVAVGKGDDSTREIIQSINSDKVKIFDREWDEKLFVDGEIFRSETNFALSQCKGDWCFYLQADEVIHEKYHEKIVEMCKKYKDEKKVEGFLLRYKHFWADYDHFVDSHGWYPKEIRIVRNNIGVYSYQDAQSFRIRDNKKLHVIEIPAYVYHYGWVRPPRLMKVKKKEQDSMHNGKEKTEEVYKNSALIFDFGPLKDLPVFTDSHPLVMKEWMKDFHWKENLNYGKNIDKNRELFGHEKLKNKLLSKIEKHIFNFNQPWGFRNYKILKREK